MRPTTSCWAALAAALMATATACGSSEAPQPPEMPIAAASPTVTPSGTSTSTVAPPPAPPSAAGLPWPNAESRANSDPWIAAHHDAITVMRPKILAVNFTNEASFRAQFKANIDGVVAALAEGSRYHGYTSAAAKKFLEPEVTKYVDLGDDTPPAGWNHKNSSRYPIKCKAGAPYQFDYGALFDPTFAAAFDLKDPDDASKTMDLCTAIGKGAVHEIWLHVDGDSDPYTCANGVTMGDFQLNEVVESKPKYDAADQRLPGEFDACAGNGCLSDDDFAITKACGRTVRILYVNATRGPGCAIHSLGHGFESMSQGGSVASMHDDFVRFGNFDLDKRLSLPFDSWYACSTDDCITWTGDNAFTWNVNGQTGSVARFDQGCGNVHFAPNARHDYDDTNTMPVLSTCEHFGLGDGPDGTDTREPWSAAKKERYEQLAPDCEGAWQVYWRQSFPGLGNNAKRSDGGKMKNWWPYLYY